MLCLVGIRDVLRKGVSTSVGRCRAAGIKVRMVTGDNKQTAEAIAIECGIVNNKEDGYKTEEHVWIGEDFWNHIEGLEQIPKMDDNTPPKPIIDKFNNTVMIDRIKN